MLNALKENCEILLGLELTRRNVLRILVLGYKCSAPRLVKSALERVADDKLFQCPEWQELSTAEPEIFKMADKRLCVAWQKGMEAATDDVADVIYPAQVIQTKFEKNVWAVPY